MRLSVVDLGIVAPNTDESQALAGSVQFARDVEALGYHRIWFAEHHASRMGASHHPELLIAAAGAQTTRIRVGSGAVLMNHYSAFKVAEMFRQLEAMYPGRVDLGMGRATAGPVLDMALQRDREHPAQADHTQQLAETLAWLHNDFPPEHPFGTVQLMPSVPHLPHTWLLGSSPSGSNLAAGLGIGYTFAGFINPAGAAPALRHYREQFRPRGYGLDEPRAILSVNVTVGETAAEAARLVSSPKAYYARVGSGDVSSLIPAADVAVRELTQAWRDQPTSIVDGQWPQFVAGSPSQVRATIEQMVEESGADEVMVQSMVPDPGERLRSHELLAEALGVTSLA
ncbi:Luciferase-like monooxygenase [Leucobacter sp. 7(1)]|uniref:MsnO8 family LLM class oxidoreductase n=1 Tax=Leucobacter sp. 7(1) TaxID=1255613 RepID=UPI00097EF131|nr:MsnO8 family LLM class oxidoreductase [Leucobacter sp. 7(1)]SJN10779.1 Luciferase-like monooxygenase [Leucobacter sp. 7(1)]